MPMEKTFNAAEAEARIYAAWESSGAFRAGAGKRRSETFTIMIPPPNVTGALHVGHAFNNTLQDILIRWHRMRGFDTLWQPGQDHAGIATQLQVEKMLVETANIRRRDMKREDFLARVWDWKVKYGQTIIDQLKRIGASCDWSRNAFTMSGAPGAPAGEEGNFHDAVIKVFVKMYEDGLIYRGKRLVNWDPHFETAISDLEVENIEEPGHMWHFKYPLAGGATYEYLENDDDGNVTLCETRDYIAIATTRPETMLGDGAVAVHPSDARYAPIVGQLCEIPVGPKEHRRLIPIITDDYPDPDFGSGAVKITGAHDFNDYAVAQRNDIPKYRLMDTRGAMRGDGAPYEQAATRAQAIAEGAVWDGAEVDTLNLVPNDLRGLDRFDARALVVDQITAEGLAVMIPNPEADPALEPVAPPPSRGRGDGGEAAAEVPDQVRDGEARAPAPEPGPQLIPLVEAKLIMKPYGDRSGVVIEPMLTDQWFVDTAKIVGPALDAVRNGDVKIMPESGEKVYFHWLENIEPWCISRHLWWGHQVPVWYFPSYKLKALLTEALSSDPDNALIRQSLEGLGEVRNLATSGGAFAFCAANREQVREKVERIYSRAAIFFDTEAEAVEYLDANYETPNFKTPLYRDPDVLDTWFSSGLWPIGTLGWPEDTEELKKYFPTDVLITGQDILFFWVARMMMMQQAVVGANPFHTVYLHQLVRDEHGKKMSKTTGNVIDPLEIIDRYGADALRFSNASMAAIGGVLKLSEDRTKGYRNFTTKLWNAARFAEMNGAYSGGVKTHKPVHGAGSKRTNGLLDRVQNAQNSANKWIVGEVAQAREAVDAALSAYRFNDAANGLYAFVWGTVCDWYLEFSKPLLASEDAEIIEETRATMAWVIDQCLILLHPFMPFITEEIWGTLAERPNMLVLEPWPEYQPADFVDENASGELRWVIALIEAVRSIRGEMGVPAGAKIPVIKQALDPDGETALNANQTLITRLARISEITPGDAPKGAVTVAVRGGTFALPLAEVIDISAEKARLQKSQGRLSKEIGGLSGRLNNPKFAASAPPEVVQDTRDNLALREEEAAKIATALARLADMA